MPELESPLTTAFQVAGLTRAIADGAARVPFPRATDRTAWAGIDAASRAEILHRAAQVVAEPWPVLPLSQRLAFERTGSRRAFEAPYFERRRRLTIVALAHAVAPEPRWAQDLVDGLGLLLEETSWCLPAHDSLPGGERRRLPEVDRPVLDLFAAETAAQLAWITEVHAEELAEVPGLLRRLGAEVTFRVLRPFATRGREHWWFGGESPGDRDTGAAERVAPADRTVGRLLPRWPVAAGGQGWTQRRAAQPSGRRLGGARGRWRTGADRCGHRAVLGAQLLLRPVRRVVHPVGVPHRARGRVQHAPSSPWHRAPLRPQAARRPQATPRPRAGRLPR